MRTSEVDVHELRRRAESARDVAERALLRARQALDASERSRRDAEEGQYAAEWAESVANSARQAAEDARDAAEEGRIVAELAAREAQQAQQDLQNFLAMAAHDLHNPITGILGYAQLLQRKNISPTMHAHALSSIERSAHQMSRLIRDLVDAGQAGAGGFPLHPEPIDLVLLVREVTESQQQTSTQHRIRVDAPETIVGSWDADRLGQVVTNLVANAVKYSPEGGEIGIQVRSDGETATVRVTDQGIGIRAEDVDRLFRPFSRLADGAKLDGTGLGLYISQGIVVAHGGRISVESQGPGTGTTFTVRLPLSGPPGRVSLAETAP